MFKALTLKPRKSHVAESSYKFMHISHHLAQIDLKQKVCLDEGQHGVRSGPKAEIQGH